MTVRLIPRLDVKGPDLVKGIHLEGLRVLGRPERFAEHYYREGADEIIYMDVVASLFGRNSLLDVIERTARHVFIPLVVGGGLRTIDDVRAVLRAGGDKVVVNTAAVQNPTFVRDVARAFGSSTVVVSMEVIRQPDGSWHCFTDNGREETHVDALEWAERAAEQGAGELMVLSVDRDGTGAGLDLNLVADVRERIDIPLIVGGGVGRVEHVTEGVRSGADAVSAGSALHYTALEHLSDSFAGEAVQGNTEFLRRGGRPSRFAEVSLPAIRGHLTASGVACRSTGGKGAA